MFKRSLQIFVRKGYLLIISIFFSHPALSSNINLIIQDQHGVVLPNAIVEINQIKSDRQVNGQIVKKLPIAVMDQVNKQFSPELLIVQQGQSVNFPNSDNIRHHVYSFSQAKSFQLKLYSGQPKDPINFDTPGVVVLGCNIHDAMVGYIYIANSAQVYKSGSNGVVSLPINTQRVQISVWHALQTAPLEHKKLIDIDAQAVLPIIINIASPAPRNTFGDQFKGVDEQ
ncbi:methylamine utilization protein [Rheinheimera sp. WS51]|uniref:methylamine utilization protein n=1 Tax=Rheinheimera sp. WS51 TaxID=3425886 RepID=UPI003D8EA1F0